MPLFTRMFVIIFWAAISIGLHITEGDCSSQAAYWNIFRHKKNVTISLSKENISHSVAGLKA